jgi:hypothetical protein
MSQWAAAIASGLSRVRKLRRERDARPGLRTRVDAVKQFQHARFKRDYAGLLADPRYAEAARFFLDQLYGPSDYAARDAEFERVVPLMARVLPNDVMHAVADLIELHSLTEELDQEMAASLGPESLDERSYRGAWSLVARRVDRDRQLALLLAVGRTLDRHTHSKVLAATLRVMRGPAHVAGLGQLQSFLESGLKAFASMRGAADFLRCIEDNEQRTIDDFFAAK